MGGALKSERNGGYGASSIERRIRTDRDSSGKGYKRRKARGLGFSPRGVRQPIPFRCASSYTAVVKEQSNETDVCRSLRSIKNEDEVDRSGPKSLIYADQRANFSS
ncbi:hypothetical protein KM043_007362 [Ampulex compressa]|nr:hypothetical protein KM043_007362 [Ampulex compressa]